MNTDNEPTHDADDSYRKAWKQAFDEAAEAPPPRVWNAIERHLDNDNRARVIPIWAKVRPWATGIAAAVTFVLTGWWAWQQLSLPIPTTAQQAVNKSVIQNSKSDKSETDNRNSRESQSTTAQGNRRQKPVTPDQSDLSESQSDPRNTRYQETSLATVDRKSGSTTSASPEIPGAGMEVDPASQPSRSNAFLRDTALALANTTPVKAPIRSVATGQPAQNHEPDANNLIPTRPAISQVSLPRLAQQPIPIQTIAPLAAFGQVDVLSTVLAGSVPNVDSERLLTSIGLLPGRPFRNRSLEIQRVVWFRNDDPIAVKPDQATPAAREKWASLSVMPSSFNPVVGVPMQPISAIANSAISNAYALSNNRITPQAPSLRSEPGGAVTVQLGAGVQLSDRWSIETGVGYLQARSTVVSPVQLTQSLVDNNSVERTLYTAVVQNNINRNTQTALANGIVSFDKAYDVQLASYNSQTQGNTSNDYRFVQIPVQMGYQLRPRRKLGLSVLGGLLTNWFVRNSVGETLEVKPSDNLYRSVTLAGTVGTRLRYRSSRRWSASVAGLYQQSLQLGTQSDASLETRPHTVGVSFGMDYHF